MLAGFSHGAGEAGWAGVALGAGRTDRATNARGSLEPWLALLALGSGRSFASVFAVFAGWTGWAGLAWISLGTLGAVGPVGSWEARAALASGDALLADGAEGAGEASLADVSLLALDAGGTRQALEAGWSGRARKTLWAVLALAASMAHTAGGTAFTGCSRGSRCTSQTLRTWRPCGTLVALVALEALLSR